MAINNLRRFIIPDNSVAVIGFGYIGSVIGAVLVDSGYRVIGIDTNQDNVELFSKGQTLFENPDLMI